ncbi:ATP-binding protein [Nonomuraea sp. NPDC050556]|uniref:HAMP domain-containing sensor histidine kinase n=1 Tax=Nonomuraea sp. NPDC050556 TaxID=3364369 RepID=UPI0037AC86D8
MRFLRDRPIGARFTVLFGALFLLSGAGLLLVTNVVAFGSTRISVPVGAGGPQVSLAAAQEHIRQLEAQLRRQSSVLPVASVVALAIMAVVSVVLGRIVAVRVLRPLRTITAATRRISADNLHERLAVPGPEDEVKRLADTIDGLLERLEGSFAAQRRFVANASHELRTPLATMRAFVDVAEGKPGPVPEQTLVLAGRIRTELDQVDRLLEGFLTLARAQHGAVEGPSVVDLGERVGLALQARAEAVAAKELRVEVVDEGSRTRGSATLLARLVDNVIDNAVTHNRQGGWVRVLTSGGRLVVETGGPVLDQAELVRLAHPFERLGADRTGSATGSGLGLSIVSAIAEAHGGGLELVAIPSGGLRVEVTLVEAGA